MYYVRNLVYILVKDQEVDAKYLSVTQMRKQRKQVMEAKKAMLKQIWNTKRFQNKAMHKDWVLHM